MEMPEEKFTKVFTFNSERKSMSTVIPLEGGGYRVYTKGASEIIMKKCSFIVVEGGKVEGFTTAQQDRLVQTVIEPMAKDGLRTISIAYKDYVQNKTEKNQVQLETGDEYIFLRLANVKSFLFGTVKICLSTLHKKILNYTLFYQTIPPNSFPTFKEFFRKK
jgi:magnesium-transporting ATPase (P-type)